jgi:hypothetical protein
MSSMRKVYLTHRKHNYRLVFLHRTPPDGSEHVDVLLAFRRKEGYAIDWNSVADLLREDE